MQLLTAHKFVAAIIISGIWVAANVAYGTEEVFMQLMTRPGKKEYAHLKNRI